MPDKGWRKRLQDKRPKTPVQAKTTGDNAAATSDPADRSFDHRGPQSPAKLSWRRTYHGSRPQTPLATTTPTQSVHEEDSRSEAGSDIIAARGKMGPMPKFSRYFSDYLSLTPASKPLEFSEPWNYDLPFETEPPIDPLVALQSIRYHICHNSNVPLPLNHNSGVLRVFEDYRKVREEKERLDSLMKEVLEGYKTAEEYWDTLEGRYQDEIRRLELIIAQGTTGMAGLIKARQGTIVDRKRTYRKTLSTGRPKTAYEDLTRGQLDEQIRLRSQKVVFHRPSSPSGPMAALSRRFSHLGTVEELPVGTPPDSGPQTTFARKAKSELDLTKMGNIESPIATSQSVQSGFSFSGDSLPDEVDASAAAAADPGIECEAFVALRELAALVARRRGIDVETFVTKLMGLYSTEKENGEELDTELHISEDDSPQLGQTETNEDIDARISSRRVRRFQSQPQLAADKDRRRHFSFEPGDDQIGVLNEDLREYEFNRPKSPAGSQSTRSSETLDPSPDQVSELSSTATQTLGAEAPRPSKIPSPLHGSTIGSTRRERSTSSLHTVSSRQRPDNRRESRSSVVTAFRENSSGSLRRPQSTSRSGSVTNLGQAESSHLKDVTDSMRLRHSVAALAAARAAGAGTNPASDHTNRRSPKGKTESLNDKSSRPEQQFATGEERCSENEAPQKWLQLR